MKIRVAGIQMGAVGSKEQNVEKAEEMLEQLLALDLRPQFVCLPEMFSYTPDLKDEFEAIDKVAEEIDGPIQRMFSAYARKLEAHIITGSYIQKRDGKHYNTSLLIAPDGDVMANYSKTHLFDTPDFKESWFITPGDRFVAVDTPCCRIGMIICYDIRFPELLRTLALEGAELIFCPAAFPIAGLSPGSDHWETLTRAAALQNMVYLVAVNQIGFKSPFYYFGRSVIVDPWGIELAKAANKECIISAELDLDYLRQMRKERDVYAHRRPDLYKL
jgi:predicted amidohydrolase